VLELGNELAPRGHVRASRITTYARQRLPSELCPSAALLSAYVSCQGCLRQPFAFGLAPSLDPLVVIHTDF
jgi:hypothetical protein